jgi:hypothetical protein
MNLKSALAMVSVSFLVGSEIPTTHTNSLLPREHVHSEMLKEFVVETTPHAGASGGQVFDNEAFSPALPWAQFGGSHTRFLSCPHCARTIGIVS